MTMAEGRRSRYLTISVLHIIMIMCQALTDEPQFAEHIPNVTVALGRDANLPCVVKNLGTHKVAWIHIDRQMILTIHRHVITKITRFSVNHDNQNTWTLRVTGVQEVDRGYYMCQVNTTPMMSQVGYLRVTVPPNILDANSTQSIVAVREGQNVTLTCKADGYPTPELRWRREDGGSLVLNKWTKPTVYEGEQLNLTKISRTEMGAYLCIATNGIPPSVSKRIIVNVDFLPMIWLPNQLVGAPIGTDVTLVCQIEAHPRAISYWVFNSLMILPTKKYGLDTKENSYRSDMRLTIRNLQPTDFGNYRCVSKNSLGETEGSVRLYDIPSPSPAPKATEIKSGATKEGYKSTPAPPKRQTTVWPAAYNPQYPRRTERPPTKENEVARAEQKPRGHASTGSAYIVRWSAPQLMIVAVQYILTGPYIPPYIPQNAH